MAKLKVGIINVTGYAGVELARLLHKHPRVELSSITGRSAAGQKLADVFPHLAEIDMAISAELGEVDLAFSAMPHKSSAEVIWLSAVSKLLTSVRISDSRMPVNIQSGMISPIRRLNCFAKRFMVYLKSIALKYLEPVW
jgi:hypothetical protein